METPSPKAKAGGKKVAAAAPAPAEDRSSTEDVVAASSPPTRGTLKCVASIVSRKTKTKRQCSRNAVDEETTLCQQHYNKWYEKTHKRKPPQPWEVYGLPPPPEPTLKYAKAVTKLLKKLRQGPGDSTTGAVGASGPKKTADGSVFGTGVNPKSSLGAGAETTFGGHIYVYRIENDDPHYFKIGFTTKAVHQRLDEWPGSVLVHSWRTEFPQYAEAIIHLYLYHWRCYRFVLYAEGCKPNDQKRFVSTCYSNCSRSIYDEVVAAKPSWLPEEIYQVIKKDQGVTAEIYRKTPKQQRYTVEKEWFRVEDYETQIRKPIQGIIDGIALNRWKRV